MFLRALKTVSNSNDSPAVGNDGIGIEQTRQTADNFLTDCLGKRLAATLIEIQNFCTTMVMAGGSITRQPFHDEGRNAPLLSADGGMLGQLDIQFFVSVKQNSMAELWPSGDGVFSLLNVLEGY